MNMKKIILITALVIFTAHAGFSQVFGKGQQAINIGIGIGHTDFMKEYYSGFFPSISASYEYGVAEFPMGAELDGVIGVGAYLGWAMSYYGSIYGLNSDDFRENRFHIAARGNYHFVFHDKLDPYAGLQVGVNIPTFSYIGEGDEPDLSKPDTEPLGGIYVGARWHFNDQLSAYAELGYLISVLNFGVSIKL